MKKNIITMIILLLSFSVFAQKTTVKVEAKLASDSTKYALFTSLTQGYTQAKIRIRIDAEKPGDVAQSCPVYTDEEGYTFLIKLDDENHIEIVEIDYD